MQDFLLNFDWSEFHSLNHRLLQQVQSILINSHFLDEIPLHKSLFNPYKVQSAFFEAYFQALENPGPLLEQQSKLLCEHLKLWQSMLDRLNGLEAAPIITPEAGDRRFNNNAWQNNLLFDCLKQSYLLTAKSVKESVHKIHGLSPQMQSLIDFYTKQWIDAISPSNFLLTNPEVIQKIIETGGANLIQGLKKLCDDLERDRGFLTMSMMDSNNFRLGETIATTPGKVIFQNDMMQLIQYDPITPEVKQKPLLIIPPWLKKFYIFDLRPHNSFIRWAIEQGYTVFIISWVNPDSSYKDKQFEDYMLEGPVSALQAISLETGQQEIDVIGYCLGGTLLACTLAYLACRTSKYFRVNSATFLTTLTDFSQVGDLSLFIDEEQISHLEERMSKLGYLDGASMATTFNLLRANDMIWSFVLNNYLLANEFIPFDLLHWNSDLMNMPQKMHLFFLRNMYQKNLLIQPQALTMGGVQLDLRKITVPTFVLSTYEDHIAPWKTTYINTQIYQGPVKFVLSGSGHVAGVINPPSKMKYGFWTNASNPADPEEWFKNAAQNSGSWWSEWHKWLSDLNQGNPLVPARVPGVGGSLVIEAAPGSYAKRHWII